MYRKAKECSLEEFRKNFILGGLLDDGKKCKESLTSPVLTPILCDESFSFMYKTDTTNELAIVKNKIGNVDPNVWINIRKYTNVYEFPFNKYETHKIKPINRAYYKIKEIIIDFEIDCRGDTFHIADSPGGFIQYTLENNKQQGGKGNTKAYTVSLHPNSTKEYYYRNEREQLGDNYSIPEYHHLIKNHPQVVIFNTVFGPNFDGDIINVENFLRMVRHFKSNKVEPIFITADGGINDSNDPNSKEILHINLIFCEIVLMLFVLKNQGTFVCKIFDMNSKFTIDILFILNCLFDTVTVTKPLTSRMTNSEKYIVCKGYNKKNLTTELSNSLFKIMVLLCNTRKTHNRIVVSSLIKGDLVTTSLAKGDLVGYFQNEYNTLFNKITQCSQMYSEIQLEAINNTLNFIYKHTSHWEERDFVTSRREASSPLRGTPQREERDRVTTTTTNLTNQQSLSPTSNAPQQKGHNLLYRGKDKEKYLNDNYKSSIEYRNFTDKKNSLNRQWNNHYR